MTFKPYSTEGFIYQAPGGGRGTRVSDDLDTIKANFMHLEKLLIASSNPPSNPRVGQLWFDASTNQLKKWNGSEWVGINVDAVDGFHASQTPAPFTIPVTGADGKLVGDWYIVAQDFRNNGFVRFSNGLIIQWGSLVQTVNHASFYNITFPITFPNHCLAVTISEYGFPNYSDAVIQIVSKSSTGFKALVDGTTEYAQAAGIMWIAIGY